MMNLTRTSMQLSLSCMKFAPFLPKAPNLTYEPKPLIFLRRIFFLFFHNKFLQFKTLFVITTFEPNNFTSCSSAHFLNCYKWKRTIKTVKHVQTVYLSKSERKQKQKFVCSVVNKTVTKIKKQIQVKYKYKKQQTC